MKHNLSFALSAAAIVGALGLTAILVRGETTTSAPADPTTQWTPDGVSTLVKLDDPALVASVPPPSPAAIVKPDPAVVRSATELMDRCLTALSEKSSDADTQYYEDGVWHFTPMVWSCESGPGAMAAILWKYRQAHPESMDAAAKARQPWLRQVAYDTFDNIVTKHHGPDGRLANPGSHECFFNVEFANTYLLLKDSLDEPTRQRWLETMRKEVAGLQANGQLLDPAKPGWRGTDGWYVNGNVDICQAAWLYLVAKATDEPKYKDLFEREWKHVLLPDQVRWKGYGLHFLKMPTKADGSDGSGYITEANDPSRPGFDKGYGSMQLSIAARLYMKSRDPRVLRVTNLLYNSELPHLERDTMILNATYGSRHSETLPFATCASEVLAWLGGRGDVLPMLPDLFQKADVSYFTAASTKNSNDPGAYRAYGFDLETILEAALDSEQASR